MPEDGRVSKNHDEKATWLAMASDWLRMIPKPKASASDNFDAAEAARGTNQAKSSAEH